MLAMEDLQLESSKHQQEHDDVQPMRDWKSLGRPGWSLVAVALLLVLHVVMAMSGVASKSVTFDELVYLSSGYSYWLTGDYRLQPESGNFPQRWASLPLLFSDVEYPSLEQPAWWGSSGAQMALQFFYKMGNNVESMLWRGRSMMVVLSVLLGVAVYSWSRYLFGLWGGLISLVLYVFSPTMLAHGPLITSDVTMAAAMMVSLGCFWIVMHRVNTWTQVASGVALGLLLLSKMSAVIMLPLAVALLVLREWCGSPLYVDSRTDPAVKTFDDRLRVWGVVTAYHLLIVLLVVWSFYGFRSKTFKHNHSGRDAMNPAYAIRGMDEEGFMGAAVVLAASTGAVPEPYLQGFSKIVRRTKFRRAFLNGQHSNSGWRLFFPYCLLVKTPCSTLLSVLAAAGILVWQFCRRGPHDRKLTHRNGSAMGREAVWRILYHGAPLWIFFVVYWGMAIMSNMNIGHRHLMPTYPVLYVFAGAIGHWLRPSRWYVSVPVLMLSFWLIATSVFAWPNYLAYFNQFAGGSSAGYRHLVDSSLDWGQDLPGLRSWLEQERFQQDGKDSPSPVYVSYFGTGDLNYYGISAQQLPSYAIWPDEQRQYRPLTGGIYCISATMLQSIYLDPFGPWCEPYEEEYQRLLKRVPEFELWQDMKNPLDQSDEAAEYRNTLKTFLELRFSRLCAFLRQREADDHVGYSILIYRLSDEEVAQALAGAPAELEEMVTRKR